MRKNQKVVAIIPARGGSKGVPRKNIRDLAGKPLIAYTIEAAKKSGYIDRIIVSTDDEEIKQVSLRYGAEVPFLRPGKLSLNDTPVWKAVRHAIKYLKEVEAYPIDFVVLLQPTSPLRTEEDIDNAIELFLESNCESLISVCKTNESPYWMHKIEKGYLKTLMGLDNYNKIRQDLPNTYMENGAIYIIKSELLYKYNSFFTSKTVPYIMPRERSVDIDDELDFKFAELLFKLRGIKR